MGRHHWSSLFAQILQAIIESRKSFGGEYQWRTSAWNGEKWGNVGACLSCSWMDWQQWARCGEEGKGLDAYEEDAEPALAAAGRQGQQAEGEHTLQGQKWNVLPVSNVQGDSVSFHIFLE